MERRATTTARGSLVVDDRGDREDLANHEEGDMEQLESLGEFFSGVGILLLSCAALWFVSVYQERRR